MTHSSPGWSRPWGSASRPVALDQARLEKQLRDLALEHAAGKIEDGAYLERSGQLRSQLATVDATSPEAMPSQRAVEWLRVIGSTVYAADVPEAKAELLSAIYDRITVRGATIVNVRLTPAADASGLALALPEVVKARPEGFEPPTV